jgi:galactose-1-phosphate uridylyltransferase
LRARRVLWETLLSRFQLVADQSCFVQLMENHGRRSGGCQPHPHCQLLGLPLVPGEQTVRTEQKPPF